MKKLLLLILLIFFSLLSKAQQIDTAEIYQFINDATYVDAHSNNKEVVLPESDQEKLTQYLTHPSVDSDLMGITGYYKFDSVMHKLHIDTLDIEEIRKEDALHRKIKWDRKKITRAIVMPLDSFQYFKDAARKDENSQQIAKQKMLDQYGSTQSNIYSVPIFFHNNTMALWSSQWICFFSI